MGGKKKRNRHAASIAQANSGQILADQSAAQAQYDADLQGLRDFEVTDFYKDLQASNIDLGALERIMPRAFEGQAAQADVAAMGALERGQVGQLGPAQGYTAQGYKGEGYTAGGTNVGGLARGADTGLSNVFNNLQVATGATDIAAREADESLAASQDLIAQTGGGGATALAAGAAKAKAGITADIDQQIKANERMRAQGEQSLQRDLLAQGNLASQFDLGQQQFNVGAANDAARFGAQARNQANQFTAGAQNQAAQFGAGAANQFALSQFGAENAMSQFNAGQQNAATQAIFGAQNQANQFNASQSNAERMAAYNAATQADAANAAATNNALAQNASNQTNFDLAQAQGQTQAQSNMYDVQANLMDISTNTLSEIDAKAAENQAVMDLGNMSGGRFAAQSNRGSAMPAGRGVAGPQIPGTGIFSDRRLKKNIKLIGKSNSGINIYLFEYINKLLGNGIFQGVMSDDIPTYAVIKHSSGFDCVDYSLLDVEFKSLI